jgi:hypothetical protein
VHLQFPAARHGCYGPVALAVLVAAAAGCCAGAGRCCGVLREDKGRLSRLLRCAVLLHLVSLSPQPGCSQVHGAGCFYGRPHCSSVGGVDVGV